MVKYLFCFFQRKDFIVIMLIPESKGRINLLI